MMNCRLGFFASLLVVGVGCGGDDSNGSTSSGSGGASTSTSTTSAGQGGASTSTTSGDPTSSASNGPASTGAGMGGAGQGGSGPASSGQGGGFSCDPTGDPCQDCIGSMCCNETTACLADPSCAACLDCLNTAASPATCIFDGTCKTGEPTTSAFITCGMKCQSVCQ